MSRHDQSQKPLQINVQRNLALRKCNLAGSFQRCVMVTKTWVYGPSPAAGGENEEEAFTRKSALCTTKASVVTMLIRNVRNKMVH